MPIKIRKIRNSNLYSVKDSNGKVFAKATTKEKAIKQKFAIEGGGRLPTKKVARRKSGQPKK